MLILERGFHYFKRWEDLTGQISSFSVIVYDFDGIVENTTVLGSNWIAISPTVGYISIEFGSTYDLNKMYTVSLLDETNIEVFSESISLFSTVPKLKIESGC